MKYISIITTTRDRPQGLIDTLYSISQESRDIPLRSVVVDDSAKEESRKMNIFIVERFKEDFARGIVYFTNGKYRELFSRLPSDLKETFEETTKCLGSDYYDSVGPRNLGLLLCACENVVFIIDDDVVVSDPVLSNKEPVLEKMLNYLDRYDICGVTWKGIPDQSTLEHLDDQLYCQSNHKVGLPPCYEYPKCPSIKPRTIGWRRKNPDYVTSGGGMVFNADLINVHFPNIFNDDWHWISYNHFVNEKNTVKLEDYSFLNKPPLWRVPTFSTLRRESIGEIIFEAMHQFSINNNKPGWLNIEEVQFSPVIKQYLNYMEKILKHVKMSADVQPISQSPFDSYSDIIEHLEQCTEFLRKLEPSFLYELADNYIRKIQPWSQLVDWVKENPEVLK